MDQYRNNGDMTFEDKRRFTNIRRQQNPEEQFTFEENDILTRSSSLVSVDHHDTITKVTPELIYINLQNGHKAVMSSDEAYHAVRSGFYKLWKIEIPTY